MAKVMMKQSRKATTPAVATGPSMSPISEDERGYRARRDLQTLTEADEIRLNKDRMNDVKTMAAKHAAAVNKQEGRKAHKNDKTVK